jgi:hypothetical protein
MRWEGATMTRTFTLAAASLALPAGGLHYP